MPPGLARHDVRDRPIGRSTAQYLSRFRGMTADLRGEGTVLLTFQTKDATKARAGAIGARKRWGPPRIIRLDDPSMPLAERALAAALLELKASREAAASATPAQADKAA